MENLCFLWGGGGQVSLFDLGALCLGHCAVLKNLFSFERNFHVTGYRFQFVFNQLSLKNVIACKLLANSHKDYNAWASASKLFNFLVFKLLRNVVMNLIICYNS